MKRAFISYAREDGDFADVVRRRLEDAGIQTWQDVDLYGGQNWRAEIDLAIRDARAVVVVMSAEGIRSAYVAYEWAVALGAGVNVIPLLLKTKAEELHPAIRGRQCLDFSDRLARPWDLLIRAIEGAASVRTATVRIPADAPPAVETAAHALDSLEAKEREAAIETLARMKHGSVVEILADAVNHPILDVRVGAAAILSHYGDTRALPGLLEGVRARRAGREERVYKIEAWQIARLGKAVVGELIQALRDEKVRDIAVEALGFIADPVAVPALKQVLDDSKEGYLRRDAVRALGRMHDPALLPVFEAALRDDELCSEAVSAAGELPGHAGEGILVQALRHESSSVRSDAAGLLEDATAEALPALVAALKDSSYEVRARAARAIGKLGAKEAVPELLDALDDEVREVWSSAGRALTCIGGPAVISGLTARLRDPGLYFHACDLLGEIGGPSAIPALVEVQADQKVSWICPSTLGKLAKPGMPAVLSRLGELLADDDASVRFHAADALGAIADPASLGLLDAALRDPDEGRGGQSVSHKATACLRQIGTPEALAFVTAWLREQRRGGVASETGPGHENWKARLDTARRAIDDDVERKLAESWSEIQDLFRGIFGSNAAAGLQNEAATTAMLETLHDALPFRLRILARKAAFVRFCMGCRGLLTGERTAAGT